ncbi:hypothetical protein RU639_002073 [Aspergillus parasiticus]
MRNASVNLMLIQSRADSQTAILPTSPVTGDSPEQDRLTVGRLYEIDCSQGQIAYLSACLTAENRSKWLVDEVLHVRPLHWAQYIHFGA